MIKKPSRCVVRRKRHYKMRRNIKGMPDKPRLTVFRSNKHIYAQVIDDSIGHTITAASTMEKAISEGLGKTWGVEAAKAVGAAIGKKAAEKGITNIVFDRSGYLYHGKVKALADAAREAGLIF